MSTPITKDLLLQAGWIETSTDKQPMFLMEYQIEGKGQLKDDLIFTLHRVTDGIARFAVVIPEHGLLNFVANTMEELESFMRQVYCFDSFN